ncbi:MAG: DivIVA domain-containing protein [Actinomycetota bacterium]
MRITPIDIQEKQFHISLRGYSPEEVDTFLDAIAGELETLHKENNDLKRRLNEVELKRETGGEPTGGEPSEIRKIMENTLISAQKSAEEIIKAAKLESENIKIESEKKSEELVLKSQDEIREMLEDIQEIKKIQDKLNNSLTEIYNRLSSVLKTEKIYERPTAVEEDLSEKSVEEKARIEDSNEALKAEDESEKMDEIESEAESGVEEKHKEKKTESFANSEIADKFFDEENIV